MSNFDFAPLEVVRICEENLEFQTSVSRACWIRDVRGRLRLVFEPHPQTQQDFSDLETSLTSQLGGYFCGPILQTNDLREAGRVAKALLAQSEPCEAHQLKWVNALAQEQTANIHWTRLERRLAKLTWLDSPGTPPWPLKPQTPWIVTFYSFKGGVGRTTALVATALQAAKHGKKVVVLDLDLEAPGLGSLLSVNPQDGALDAIVQHLATDAVKVTTDIYGFPGAISPEDTNIAVVPAGRLNRNYLEKLARLDFVGSSPDSHAASGLDNPVHAALKALLLEIKRNLKFQDGKPPDLILLDARAGLHDLAGLSLHGLSHLDVLLVRASEQSYAGLELTIETLGKDRATRCVIAHSFVPEHSTPQLREREINEFRQRVYEIFERHVYDSQDPDKPEMDNTTASHFPVSLTYDPELVRYSDLNSIKGNLDSNDYRALWQRLQEKGGPA